jgi:hypothetical protein
VFLLMHVLLGKLLELAKMKQEPLRVFPRAHFPRRWRGPRTIKKPYFACADLLVEPGNQAPCMGAGVVLIAKLRTQQVLLCINAGNERRNKQWCEKYTDSGAQ